MNYIMSNAIKHYGLCCAGSHCVQTNQAVTLLLICSICGNVMHESCGVTSGDNSLICFPCHGDNVAVGLEEVFNVNLAAEFSIEESSDGVTFNQHHFLQAMSYDCLLLRCFFSAPKCKDLFECGLLESNDTPWLAASPDAFAVLLLTNDDILLLRLLRSRQRYLINGLQLLT
jgi:hypothetical protein